MVEEVGQMDSDEVDETVAGAVTLAAGDEQTAFAAARRDYESGQGTQVEIAERYGLKLSALKWRIRRDLWKTRYRSKQVDRPQIVKRLFRVLELQVIDLELEMQQMAMDNKRSGEREAAVLNRLATNLEKLVKLEGATQTRARPPREAEIKRMREKLTQQIENLVRRP